MRLPDQIFRWLFVFILLSILFISGFFRARARKSEPIARVREGKIRLLLRLLLAALLYLPMLAYMLNPAWMDWSAVTLPVWARWIGAALGLAALPAITWVMSSIGKNVSETLLTKEHHQLVTKGPYRWIRHPLYAVALAAFFALSLLAANAYLALAALVATIIFRLVVIPQEEVNLVAKFGDDYRKYQGETGALVPRLLGRLPTKSVG